MHKYAKLSCFAYVEASKSILFAVKPLFLFLENVLLMWQGLKKKNYYLKGIPLASLIENLHADQTDLLWGPILWFWEEKQLVQVARADL